MRISASTVAAHRFGVVRRRGYDPAEVDAAMERVSDTLHEYELLTARLEEQARAQNEPTEAIRRTFEAAERTKDEMIAEAAAEAERIRLQAEQDIATMVEAAWTEAAQIRTHAESEAAELVGRAAHRLDVAEREAERQLQQSEHRSAESQIAAESSLEESKLVMGAAIIEAEAAAEALLDEARQHADALLATAAAREKQLSDRLVALELALADARRQLHALGEAALAASDHEGVAEEDEEDEEEPEADDSSDTTIDLTEQGEEVEEDERADFDEGTMVVELASRRETVFAAPDGSGMPPAERPILDPAEVTSKQDGTATHYQRAGGLRSRIEGLRTGD
jgi:DivIVA domain-containing protein